MEAYLDNSATTSCSKAATEKMVELLTQDYGNPSSMHMKGVIAEKYITEAKKKIAKTLKVDENDEMVKKVKEYASKENAEVIPLWSKCNI